MKTCTFRQLHTLEDDIIQTGGLLKALQKMDCDDAAQISLLNALEKQIQSLEENFYKLWRYIPNESGY